MVVLKIIISCINISLALIMLCSIGAEVEDDYDGSDAVLGCSALLLIANTVLMWGF